MMRKIQKLISQLMVLIIMGSLVVTPPVKADAADALTPYREKLAELNRELRVNYSFPSEEQLVADGETYADLVKFYTDMTMAEFRDYIVDAYEKAIATEDQTLSGQQGGCRRLSVNSD